jgi:molybdate transport system substrate-binding protein
MKKIALLVLIGTMLVFSATAQRHEILIAAAASLTDVLTALQPAAEQAIGAGISINFGGSGALRKQIEEGAPVDVFFSAASSDMDLLENAHLIDAATRKNILSNVIVLIGGDGQAKTGGVEDLKKLLSSASLLAIGNPDSVPAGRYAVQALQSLDLYDIVEKKLVLGGNVRQILQYVESGSAPLGIVFSTDAASVKPGSPARILYAFPGSALKTPVLYPVAVIAASKYKTEAARLIAFLQGKIARETFEKAGFGVE